MAYTAMIPPMVELPVSPMNTWAGWAWPEKADKCTDRGTDKDYQFFRAGMYADIPVAGIFNVARYVGEVVSQEIRVR